MNRSRSIAGCLIAAAMPALADVDLRIKGFLSHADVPPHAVLHAVADTPLTDLDVDVRAMGEWRRGDVRFVAHYELLFAQGDSIAAGGTTPRTGGNDDDGGERRRFLGLRASLDDGDRHRLAHRLDRLSVHYEHEGFSFGIGRQALSLGNGLVFQPLDLVNPFAPAEIDRDYKAGDDMAIAQWLLADGGDVQAVVVGRRDRDGDRRADVASALVKWHQPFDSVDANVLLARHYRDAVAGVSVSAPVGASVARLDYVLTRLDDGGVRHAALVNIDLSFELLARPWYLFGEWFYNGFADAHTPADLSRLPRPLTDRLSRGESFTLARRYAALGGTVQWHPLLTQSALWLASLDDGSSLAQTVLRFEPGDHHVAEIGATFALGDRGEEFGGVPVSPAVPLTAGGGRQVFIRYFYYY